jgi:CheY-like chemotaxis protein
VDDRKTPTDRPLVLVVEDEPILRMTAVDMVEEAGYTAVEAHNAIEAVAILEARTEIRIVFTDIDMPGGMNGMLLAAAIRDRWPPIEIILTSGAMTPAADLIPARSVFLSKPYSQRELEGALGGFSASH